MTITELIAFLQERKSQYGDIELKALFSDGHSSWCGVASVSLKNTKEWPMKEKAWIISIEGGY